MAEDVTMPEKNDLLMHVSLADVIAQFADLAEAFGDFRAQVEARLCALEARSPCPMLATDGEP
jgi:hypothetical protein